MKILAKWNEYKLKTSLTQWNVCRTRRKNSPVFEARLWLLDSEDEIRLYKPSYHGSDSKCECGYPFEIHGVSWRQEHFICPGQVLVRMVGEKQFTSMGIKRFIRTFKMV